MKLSLHSIQCDTHSRSPSFCDRGTKPAEQVFDIQPANVGSDRPLENSGERVLLLSVHDHPEQSRLRLILIYDTVRTFSSPLSFLRGFSCGIISVPSWPRFGQTSATRVDEVMFAVHRGDYDIVAIMACAAALSRKRPAAACCLRLSAGVNSSISGHFRIIFFLNSLLLVCLSTKFGLYVRHPHSREGSDS